MSFSVVSWARSLFGVYHGTSRTSVLRPNTQIQLHRSIDQTIRSLFESGIFKNINFEARKIHIIKVPQRNKLLVGSSNDQISLNPERYEEIIGQCVSLLKGGHVVGINFGHIQATPLGSGRYTVCEGAFEIDKGSKFSQDIIDEISNRVGKNVLTEATAKQNPHNHHWSFYLVLTPTNTLKSK